MTAKPPTAVLLVDDNRDDRALIRRELSRHFPDFEITEVRGEVDLRQALKRERLHLVVTDFELRWTNGLEVLERVRERFPDCPVIMFTDTGTQEIAVAAMKAGLDDYIVKSAAHYVRLAAAVDGALGRAAARAHRRARQERFDTMLATIGVGVFRAATDGGIREANAALLSLLGASSLADIQSLDLSALVSAARDVTRASVVIAPRLGGGSIDVRVSGGAVEDGAGGFIEGVVRPLVDKS